MRLVHGPTRPEGSHSTPSFGIDAPAVPAGLAAAAVVLGCSAVGMSRWNGRRWPSVTLGCYGAVFAFSTASYMFTTLRGKFTVWDRLLDEAGLRGTERVLDLGCGRGAVLLLAARRLPNGQAIGVDLWRTVDQSGNDIEVTRSNAQAMGVADRVELHTADMTALPIVDDSIDLVVSNLAIHNIADPALRKQAVREAVRVLRPGGRIMLADFRHATEYRGELLACGMTGVARRGLGWRLWYGGPWAATQLVTATKP